MELYCNINVLKNILTEETDNHFTILQRKTKEYHYIFFLPKEISDFEYQIEIPLAAEDINIKKCGVIIPVCNMKKSCEKRRSFTMEN